MLEYYQIIIKSIKHTTGLSDPILHLHAGMIVLLAARLVTRRRLATGLPLLIVIAAELANEILDRMILGWWAWPDTISDVFYTLLWPIILTVGARIRNGNRKLSR